MQAVFALRGVEAAMTSDVSSGMSPLTPSNCRLPNTEARAGVKKGGAQTTSISHCTSTVGKPKADDTQKLTAGQLGQKRTLEHDTGGALSYLLTSPK